MAEPLFHWVPLTQLDPNPWNPNAMDRDMFGKAVESIHQFGFVDPVTVRQCKDRYQIIDGEHRWKAGQEHSGLCQKDADGKYVLHVPMDVIAVTDLGVIDDTIAKQLTIVLNETRGTFDPKKMGALLTDLVTIEPLPALLEVLPFTKERFNELAALPSVDWDAIESTPPAGAKAAGGRDERWVERVYRLPADAAETLDEAVRTARDGPGAPDWRALQTIAEHFLGT